MIIVIIMIIMIIIMILMINYLELVVCVYVCVCVCVCVCSSLSGRSCAGLMIVSHYAPQRGLELRDGSMGKAETLTHHTHPSPGLKGTGTDPCQKIILNHLSRVQTHALLYARYGH